MQITEPVVIQAIQAGWLRERSVGLDVLRLDEWHPVVSGNKWFKLHYYLRDAVTKGFTKVATFGGAYSNHIVATAFACREAGLNSVGIIRGEKPAHLSHTLRNAEAYGLKLHFVSREVYKYKEELTALFPGAYWISEGGYGDLGATGAGDIAELVTGFENYTHIVCAVGKGTTLAGLIKRSLPYQTVIGFSTLKNNVSVKEEIADLLSEDEKKKPFVVGHDYHFGGYAKCNAALIDYMNRIWQDHRLPLDFVYTAKAFYGLQDWVVKGKIIGTNSRVLFIHTGGLQGNVSLGKEALSFSTAL